MSTPSAAKERRSLAVLEGLAIFRCPRILALVALFGASYVTTVAQAKSSLPLAPLTALGIERSEAARVQRWLLAASTSMRGPRLGLSRAFERALRRRGGARCLSDTQCVAKVARRRGTRRLVMGDVGSIGGAYMLYLRLVSAHDGAVLRQAHGVVDPRRGVRSAISGILTKLLDPARYVGFLKVSVKSGRGWFYLDGRRVGQGSELSLKTVPVGTHALRVTAKGHHDYVRFVRIPFRRWVKVSASLTPLGVQKHEMNLVSGEPLTDAELPWYRRWWAVAAFGAVVFAAATTTAALVPKTPSSDHGLTIIRP